MAQSQDPTAKPEDKCSIEGTVVNAVTGTPVKKARLFLLGRRRYATTTDSAGHFLFDDLDAGSYSLTADHNGFPDQVYSPHGGKPKNGSILELSAGQDVKEIVFKLVPSAVITGRVLDEDGDPLSGVSVACLGVSYHDGKRQLSEPATRYRYTQSYTNEFGDFRLVMEWARKCVIKATHPETSIEEALEERPVAVARAKARVGNERYVPTYYPNTAYADSASVLDVPPGAQISGVNVTLQRSRTVEIKGHVTISPAACAEQTFVYLSQEAGKPVKASPQGLFQMNGVLPGSYLLDAGCHLEEKPYYARTPLEIRDANIEGIELALQPMSSIHGHVIFENNLNGGKSQLVLHTTVSWVTLDLKGDSTFSMDSLTPGSYDFSLDGPPGVYIKSVHMGDRDITDTGFDLVPGVAPEEITVVLSRNVGTVEGSVKNGKDDPAVGALITLIPDADHRSNMRRYKTATTDQNGHFIVKGVIPGDYKAYAWEDMEENAYEDPDFMKSHEADGKAVSIKESGHETLQLKLIPAETSQAARPAQ